MEMIVPVFPKIGWKEFSDSGGPQHILGNESRRNKQEKWYEVPIHEIIDAVQFIQGRSGLSMSDLFTAYTYRKLSKIISQIK